MSGYNYNDQRGCRDCFNTGGYQQKGQVNNEECLPACLNRFNSERSDMDKMYYQFFVQGKGPLLPKQSINPMGGYGNMSKPPNSCQNY